jgi:hypothetical protein
MLHPYESALDWLVLSGMIYRIYCTEKPELPSEAVLTKGDILKEFKGAMAEIFVLGSLLAQGFKTPHYWTLQGNKAEVDFLIQNGLEIIPIEVKAEDNVNGKSFADNPATSL